MAVITKRDLLAFNDGRLQTITHYDQLNRIRLVRSSDGADLSPAGEADGIKVKTVYYNGTGGGCVITSAPYRGVTPDPLEWNRTRYDLLGRVSSVSTLKGSEPDTSTACQTASNQTGITQMTYDVGTAGGSGYARTRVTDPAGRLREEYRDALGRLRYVIEDPLGVSGQAPLNYETAYQYDPADNLTGVVQGAQTRSFLYTTLGRLRSAINPESNTDPNNSSVHPPTTFQYYASGDLMSRTDARGSMASYTYDELHRIRTKSYAGYPVTPPVDYQYYLAGEAAPNVGQLKSVISSAVTTTYTGYDGLGRITSMTQLIPGLSSSAIPFNYTWWLNDAVRAITYPSGRTVSYDVDLAGRAVKVFAPGKTYVDLTLTTSPPTDAYTPDGRIARMRLGNGLWETYDYQPPGSPTRLKLGTGFNLTDRLELEYHYWATQNNGNLLQQVIRRRNGTSDWTWTQSFNDSDSYDGVNRLKKAFETSNATAATWIRNFGYDRYGNRWVTTSGNGITSPQDVHEPTSSSNFDALTNRLNVAGSQYDAAGNQTVFTPFSLTWDAGNRNVRMESAALGTATFDYDGDGRRVKKTWTPAGATPVTTFYVYDAMGRLAAEYSDQAGQAGTSYPFADLLGSVRAVTDGAGAVVDCYDYLPFGRYLGSGDNQRSNAGCYPNLNQTVTGRLPQKFTGKERDVESGLDFFGARYYSGAQGRFLSTDPFNPIFEFQPGNDDEGEGKEQFDSYISNPQNWNRYGYALNNPLAFKDEDGRVPVPVIVAGIGAFAASPAGQRAITAGSTYLQRYAPQLQRISLTVGTALSRTGYAISNEVFALGGALRGKVVEALMGVQGPFTGFPGLDRFSNGVATSIKSIDLFAKSYQSGNAILSRLSGYADQLAQFERGAFGGVVIEPGQVKQRLLQIVVPKGGIKQYQDVLQRLLEYSRRYKDLKIEFLETP